MGELHIPSITYRYVISTDPASLASSTTTTYQWVLDRNWSDCSNICNGEQHRKQVCVATTKVWHESEVKTRQVVVLDKFCADQHPPASVSRVCNSQCDLEWKVIELDECSAKCGPGFRHRKVHCSQKLLNHNRKTRYIKDVYCEHIGPKPPETVPCNATDCRISFGWRYTEWSSCSVQGTCGKGQQSRQVQCVRFTYWEKKQSEETNVSSEQCLQHLSEPVTNQACKVDCPRWNTSPWSKVCHFCFKCCCG